MKKHVLIILALILLLSLTACDTNSPAEVSPSASVMPSPSLEIVNEQIPKKYSDEYVTELFGAGIITVKITADPAEWAAMLKNTNQLKYISCDIVINGAEYKNAGVKTRENSSFAAVSDSDDQRRSLSLKFDEYVDGQTCFGLTQLVINGLSGDDSYLKQYLAYDLMDFAGVTPPLYEYASVSVNGSAWSFSLCVEEYSEKYLERVYGDTEGELFNVKTPRLDMKTVASVTDIVSGGMEGLPASMTDLLSGGGFPAMGSMTDMPQRPDGGMASMTDLLSGQGGAFFGFPVASITDLASMLNMLNLGDITKGGALKYSGDSADDYGAIFDNSVFETPKETKARIIAALKALRKGTEFENYFDIDQVLRYLAAQTVVVNLDSYTSITAQNYCLLERDGALSMLPKDFSASFGTLGGSDISYAVNFPIDTPVSGVTMEERPLVARLLENVTYKSKYHAYLQEIADNYLANASKKIADLDAKIFKYVQNDPARACTLEEYKDAVAALDLTFMLRTESVLGQLSGSLPSTVAGQQENPHLLIDTSEIESIILITD